MYAYITGSISERNKYFCIYLALKYHKTGTRQEFIVYAV